jgi:hypothetical protein
VNHGFHLAFEIVTLVNHVGHIGGRAGFPDLVVDLVEDAEDLVRIMQVPSSWRRPPSVLYASIR